MDLPLKCTILSVPMGYMHSISTEEEIQLCQDLPNFQCGSNTLILNETNFVKLGLGERDSLRSHWAILQFTLNEPFGVGAVSLTKRLFHIAVYPKLNSDIVVISDDLLFNLGNDWSQISKKILKDNNLYLMLTREPNINKLKPNKATKLMISLYQSESHLEESFVDKLLVKYFSNIKYLCENDVFGVPLSGDTLELINNTSLDTVYFKVCKIHGSKEVTSEFPDFTEGFLIDSTVSIYQKTNHHGYFPSRNFPCFYKNFKFLFDREKCMKSYKRRCNQLPECFDNILNMLLDWIKPFLMRFSDIKDAELDAIFLLCGKNGSGKSLLLDAVSKCCGMAYLRFDCVSIGASAPGQAEAKLKNIFSQSSTAAPCILHLANIELLGQNAELKDDVRVISCFEQLIKQFEPKWPVIIIASSQNCKNVSSLVNHLFMERTTLIPPTVKERENIVSWLVDIQGISINQEVLQSVSAQTSGFVFRDLEVLVSLALKEKYKRYKIDNKSTDNLICQDFSKIISLMHKSYSDSIGAPKVPSVSWKDVGGLEHLKKEIMRSLRSRLLNKGLVRSGMLLHGPPGTGKTLLAKAVATQCGRNFLSVKGPELLNMYFGQSEHNVRDLFELAKAASPCIVFFDELDSLAPNRGRSSNSGGVMDRVVSQLLAEMDDLSSSNEVFVMGATNRPDLIDSALLRPGRLDKLLYVGPCEDRNSQLSVMNALTRKLSLASDVDLAAVVSQLPSSVSGAQMSALCSAAWMSSARQLIQECEDKSKLNPHVVVTQDHFLSAVSVISGGS